MPSPQDGQKTSFDIKKIDTTGGSTVRIEGVGPELPITLSGANRPKVKLFSDGTNYWVI
jgi:hypothetical protein